MTFANRKFIGFLGAATVVIVAEYILVLSDGVIAGQVIGERALGAVNMLMPIFMIVSFFTWLLAVGTSIVYSDAMARMRGRVLSPRFWLASSLVWQCLSSKGSMLALWRPTPRRRDVRLAI